MKDNTERTTITVKRDQLKEGAELAILIRRQDPAFAQKFAVRINGGTWFKGFDSLTDALAWINQEPLKLRDTMDAVFNHSNQLKVEAEELTSKIEQYQQLIDDLAVPQSTPPFP